MNQEDADNDGSGNVCDDMDLCPAVTVLGRNAPGLDTIRMFRDQVLASNSSGKILIDFYYHKAGELSEIIEQNPQLKEKLEIIIKGLIPMMHMYLDMDSVFYTE